MRHFKLWIKLYSLTLMFMAGALVHVVGARGGGRFGTSVVATIKVLFFPPEAPKPPQVVPENERSAAVIDKVPQ